MSQKPLKFTRLLAKSLPENEPWQGAATYVGHTAAVMTAADALIKYLAPQILHQLGLTQVPLEKIAATVRLGSYLHDHPGKANLHFQVMVRLKDLKACKNETEHKQQQRLQDYWKSINQRQMVRHEVLSGLLAMRVPSFRAWLQECQNADFMAAIWAAMGHHLKLGGKAGKKLPEISHLADGTGRYIDIYTQHDNFTALLKMGTQRLGLPAALPEFPNETWHVDTLQYELNELLEEFEEFEDNLDEEQLRFIAAVKATVIVADVAGSALPKVLSTQPHAIDKWIEQALSLVLQESEIDNLIQQRLKQNSPRPFQRDVANTSDRVTLVKAGCGTGKTVAAYLWAKKWAQGRRLFFGYPTTGTASQGYLDYAAETEIETLLMHSRAAIDLEAILFSNEAQHEKNTEDDEDAERIDARLASFQAWQAKLIVCTVDSILGLVQNHRKPLYSWSALCQSVFVFDEVHAYDDKLFGSLLRFLKTFRGAPILLMSASFTDGQLNAIRKVIQDDLKETLKEIPGPHNLEILDRYVLQPIPDTHTAWQQIKATLQKSEHNKVLWVTNTVNTCIELYQEAVKELKSLKITPLVYHSRYRYQDRVGKHQAVIEAFKSDRPILAITTQVCEMSLDLSAHLLVTAMAPAPALIQRLGRLNRQVTEDEQGNVLLVSGQVCSALIYPWKDVNPYKTDELATGQELVDSLRDIEISQEDLSKAAAKIGSKTPEESYSNWLDGKWRTFPGELREAGYTLTVLLEDDLPNIDRSVAESSRSFGVEAQRWTVPVPLMKGYEKWNRRGFYPIAPRSRVTYSKEIGARVWQTGITLTTPKMKLHLGDPGMTLLHRAGLAGLYMTLKQLDTINDRPGNLTWDLTSRRINLSWHGNDLEVLDWLLKQAFQIDQDGLIELTGLKSKTIDVQNKVTLHQGIRGTFLQHPSTCKTTGIVSKSLSINENSPQINVKYQALSRYAHQEFASNLCDKNGNLLKEAISVAGWLNPGAVVRHTAFSGQTSFEETPEYAFILLFATVACQYFVLRSRLRDKRAQYALVIPEVIDLEVYAKCRLKKREFGYREFHASSWGDAGLRFLTYESAIETTKKHQSDRCQVITLGTVAWSSQQKTRTNLEIIEATEEVCRNYKISGQCFTDRIIQGKESGFVAPSFARELIADNLARGHAWYTGLAEKVNSGGLFKTLTYEREGLYSMVQNALWDHNAEKLFVQACHEALRNTYGKIGGYAKDKGEAPNFDRENERIRTGLGRCKNAETFRQFITDFWSRAGQLPTLQSHWNELLPLATSQQTWKVAKDLTLLALASYKGKGSTNDDSTADNDDIP
jgi:CRISPR-associated endonuclease/helicase Cas3